MSSYRNFSRSDGVLPQSSSAGISGSISFKDVGTAFFSSLSAGYSIMNRNTLPSLEYTGILCSSTNIEYSNSAGYLWADLEMGTDIRPLNSTVKVDAGFSRSDGVSLYQGAISEYSADMFSIGPSLYTLFGKYAELKYEASFSHSRNIAGGEEMEPVNYLSQSATLSVFPFKDFSISIGCNHYYNNLLTPDPSTWFGNIGLRYKIRKVELILDWTNVFNTDKIVTLYHSDISSYCSVYNLRPSEILLRVRFSIL